MPAERSLAALRRGLTLRVPGESMDDALDAAGAAGLDAVRLPLDWARCEPTAGCVDDDAFALYRDAVAACTARGLPVLVSANGGDLPPWLGHEFWLDLQSPERYAQWVGVAAERLGGGVRQWTTLDDPNAYALQRWVIGAGGRRALDIAATVRTLDHMTAAHVLAYEELHARLDQPIVGMNVYALSVYELGRLMHDVLVARHRGVRRDDLRAWLTARRDAWYAGVGDSSLPERAVRRLARSGVQLEMALPRAAGAAYISEHERCVDVVQIDHHQTAATAYLRLPDRSARQVRRWKPVRGRADTPGDPTGLARYLELTDERGLDTWVVETRPGTDADALLAEISAARRNGVPVTHFFRP